MQEAGADAILETAFTLADGLEYCRTGEQQLENVCLKAIINYQSILSLLYYDNPFAVLIGYCGTRQFGTGHSGTSHVNLGTGR